MNTLAKPSIPVTAICAEPDTVSVIHACRELRVGERRVRQLIAERRLDRQGRHITAASLQQELASRRRNPEIKPAIACIPGDSLPEICKRGLLMGDKQVHDGNVVIKFPEKQLHGLTLLAIPHAAAVVGLTEDRMRALVASGQLPSVAVGHRRRISVEMLQRFARGERLAGEACGNDGAS